MKPHDEIRLCCYSAREVLKAGLKEVFFRFMSSDFEVIEFEETREPKGLRQLVIWIERSHKEDRNATAES